MSGRERTGIGGRFMQEYAIIETQVFFMDQQSQKNITLSIAFCLLLEAVQHNSLWEIA